MVDKPGNSTCWPEGTKPVLGPFLHGAQLRRQPLGFLTPGENSPRDDMNKYYPLIARAVEGLDRTPMKLAGRSTSGRAKPSRNCALTARALRRGYRQGGLALEEAIRKVEAEAARHSLRKHAPSRGRRFPWRALPTATKFNPATTVSRLHRTEMIGRRLSRADEYRYSWPPRRMTATTQIFRPSRLVALTALIIITMMSRARAGQRFLVMMAVLALAVLVGIFAYRGMFGAYVFPAVPPILKAGIVPTKSSRIIVIKRT